MNTENQEGQGLNVAETIEKLKGNQDFQTFIDNQKKQHWESNFGKELKTVYDSMDGVFKEVLGVQKADTEKTTEFAKKQLTALNTELKELREKAKSTPDVDKIVSEKQKLFDSQFSELQKTYESTKQELETYKSKITTTEILSGIDKALTGKEYNPALGKEELEELIEVRRNRIKNNAKIVAGGKVVYYRDADQKDPYIDTLGNVMNAEQVANEVFSSLFKVKKQGGGNPQGTETSTETKGEVAVLDMSKIKTKNEFHNEFKKFMAQKGFTATQYHTENFIKIQKATQEHYKYETLPS